MIAMQSFVAINAIICHIASMASITIRNLDEKAKQALRERAAKNGRSMEEEARLLLSGRLPAQARHDPSAVWLKAGDASKQAREPGEVQDISFDFRSSARNFPVSRLPENEFC